MLRSTQSLAGAAISVLALTLAGCAATESTDPSPSPSNAPSSPTLPAAPTDTPEAEPSAPAGSPSEPPESPTDEVMRFDIPVVARITDDGVAVHVRPGLDEPLVEGSDLGTGTAVDAVRLAEGDRVGVVWGPMLHDGLTWYAVRHHDTDTLAWSEGWIAADALEPSDEVPNLPLVVIGDGQGEGLTVSGTAPGGAQLYVNVLAAPMPGTERCEAAVTIVDPSGQRLVVGSGTVSDLTTFFASPLEQGGLRLEGGGEVSLEVETDCSWAASVENPQG